MIETRSEKNFTWSPKEIFSFQTIDFEFLIIQLVFVNFLPCINKMSGIKKDELRLAFVCLH
jgi:hypothetical protein